ncbi:MAG TPA: aminotransferase class IV [Polyangiales bacterium]
MSGGTAPHADGVASIDGALFALADARVPALDRGFLYGDAVFEALRTFRGEPDALDAHLARLFRSCEIVGIAPPFSREVLASEVRAAIAAVPSPERYVRIMISRGDSPHALAPLGPHHPRRVVLVRPLHAQPPGLYQRGVRVTSAVAPPSALSAGAKPSAYLANMLAIAAASRAGADDALLLGAAGELLEGATSSVFLVRAGQLLTPPLSLGILPGITRERVWSAAVALGLPVCERLLTIHDAYRADELFLTSSVRQVVGIVDVDGMRIGGGVPGPVTLRVDAAYRAALGLDHHRAAG